MKAIRTAPSAEHALSMNMSARTSDLRPIACTYQVALLDRLPVKVGAELDQLSIVSSNIKEKAKESAPAQEA